MTSKWLMLFRFYVSITIQISWENKPELDNLFIKYVVILTTWMQIRKWMTVICLFASLCELRYVLPNGTNNLCIALALTD